MFECEFTVVNFDIPAMLVDTEVVVETDVDVTDTVGLVLLLDEEAELIDLYLKLPNMLQMSYFFLVCSIK